jgi:hypothetical protein
MKYLYILLLILSCISCRKINDYFRDPETSVITETIHSTTLTGYAANISMSLINGHSFDFASISRSNPGFPCSAVIQMDMDVSGYKYTTEKADHITIAGLWADSSTAVLSIIYTGYHTHSNTLDIVGIETIPVILDGNYLHVALAGQDISLNPDEQSLLAINLTTFQIESELLRLDMPRPGDVYVAVLQKAYFIDINTKGTHQDPDDDDYTISGGGQLVEVFGNDAEIVQQAMVDVKVGPGCILNPVSGMALIKVTGLEEKGFPELGTAVLEFSESCSGSAKVFAATGMYVGSNGKDIEFYL